LNGVLLIAVAGVAFASMIVHEIHVLGVAGLAEPEHEAPVAADRHRVKAREIAAQCMKAVSIGEVLRPGGAIDGVEEEDQAAVILSADAARPTIDEKLLEASVAERAYRHRDDLSRRMAWEAVMVAPSRSGSA
jgi:hypothetical protein